MSETNFTPGPWFVETDFYVYGGDGRKIKGEYFDGVELPLVCYAGSDSRDRTENKANAALIAAAPEMYRKLEWLQREFDESDDEELVAIGWEIELILKKARGEE